MTSFLQTQIELGIAAFACGSALCALHVALVRRFAGPLKEVVQKQVAAPCFYMRFVKRGLQHGHFPEATLEQQFAWIVIGITTAPVIAIAIAASFLLPQEISVVSMSFMLSYGLGTNWICYRLKLIEP
jgi:hypothetical protein